MSLFFVLVFSGQIMMTVGPLDMPEGVCIHVGREVVAAQDKWLAENPETKPFFSRMEGYCIYRSERPQLGALFLGAEKSVEDYIENE